MKPQMRAKLQPIATKLVIALIWNAPDLGHTRIPLFGALKGSFGIDARPNAVGLQGKSGPKAELNASSALYKCFQHIP